MTTITNNSEIAASTTKGFLVDAIANNSSENSTIFPLDKGNSTVFDDDEVF